MPARNFGATRTTLPALMTAVLAATALAAPAAAQTEPVYETKTFYFECQGALPLQNVEGGYGWSETAPAGSYQDGDGCGYLDSSLDGASPGNDFYDGVFGGFYDGAVRDMNVELHDLLLTQLTSSTLLGTVPFDVILQVDGETVIDTRPGDAPEVEPTLSESGLTQKLEFSLTNLGLPEAAEREFVLTIMQGYLDTQAAWVFGAREVPAGITFNPPRLQPLKIRRP